MVDYRMMDEGCMACYCLHGGLMPVEDCLQPGMKRTWGESNAGVPQGTIARYLRALCQNYGSCAVLAIDGDSVVGTLRFYPSDLDVSLRDLQQEQSVKSIAAFDVNSLPAKEALSEKSLCINCFQVAEVGDGVRSGQPSKYLRRGIGTKMLKTLIGWASGEGWDEIRGTAIQHIRPLMAWSNLLSVERYRSLGFDIGEGSVDEGIRDAVVAMREGHHGEVIKKLWEPYAHLSNEEAATIYEVSLDLKR